MFQGTGSGVGKSIICAGFCRALKNRGIRVAPFKAQNMALNSFVTPTGMEMGRAQVYQAEACGLIPDVRMNPVLLKPTAEARSQVILMGKPVADLDAKNYYLQRNRHLEIVKEAFDSLAKEFDVIILEGAGSPAEINLQATDIVNMTMASYTKAPVIIIGDIDRGGVFAWLKGTYDLILPRHKPLVAGFVINKFRGDISLLEPGIRQFTEIVQLPVFGVLPWFHDIAPDQEDGVFVKAHLHEGYTKDAKRVKIAVVHLPRISNFTDFLPLDFETDVEITFKKEPIGLEDYDCLIIPGTKTTRDDLDHIRSMGWERAIKEFALSGRMVVGICGGYQMLGMEIRDPEGIDGSAGTSCGLGLLPIVTEMTRDKSLTQRTARFKIPFVCSETLPANGYEIHMGVTRGIGEYLWITEEQGANFGAMHTDHLVFGTYLHGLFENDALRRAFINFLRKRAGLSPLNVTSCFKALRERQLDRLGAWIEDNLDMDALMQLIEKK